MQQLLPVRSLMLIALLSTAACKTTGSIGTNREDSLILATQLTAKKGKSDGGKAGVPGGPKGATEALDDDPAALLEPAGSVQLIQSLRP